MDSQQLRKQLEELHAELEETQSVDDDTRQTLAEIDRHIQMLLAGPDRAFTTRHHPLTARLRESLVGFETAHPNLVVNIERVLDAFNEMGI